MGWDAFAKADRRVTFGQGRNGIPFQPSHLSRKGLPALDRNSVAELLQLVLIGCALHLHPVAAPMAKAWIGESLLQLPVAGEQEQAFAVGIQAACGIDPWQLDQISQAAPATAWFWRELTQASIGLVQQQNIVLVLLVSHCR